MSVPPGSRPPLRPSTNPPMWTLTLKTLIRTASGKEESRNTKNEVTARAWHERIQNLRHFNAVMKKRRITDGAIAVHFGLRLLDRAADHATCHNYPGINQARELRHLQRGSSS